MPVGGVSFFIIVSLVVFILLGTFGAPIAAELAERTSANDDLPASEELVPDEEAETQNTQAETQSTELETQNAEADPTGNTQPTEEGKTLLSETEVNSFLVLFYDQDGSLLYEVIGSKGKPVEKPAEDPQQEGQVFLYWYLVDADLQGDPLLPYDFERAITGPTYLKALYLPEEEDPQTPEEPKDEDALQDITGEVTVQLSVALIVEGEELEDGAYLALLTGADLPEEGIIVANEGEKFPFPELVFTAKDLGTHVFELKALVEEPLPTHIYDLRVQKVRVDVFVDIKGQLAALVHYPKGTDRFFILHSVQTDVPTVRVYVNLLPGQKVNFGEEVVFTAELEHCGKSPRLQWQYSPDSQNWTDITGANDSELAILLTPSNAAGYWRVAVTITD